MGALTMAELEDKVCDAEFLLWIELGLTCDHGRDEFFDLFGGGSRESDQRLFGFSDLGVAFDGCVPDQDGYVHGAFGSGVVVAGLLEDGLRIIDQLIGEAGLPRRRVGRGWCGCGPITDEGASFVITKGAFGLAARA